MITRFTLEKESHFTVGHLLKKKKAPLKLMNVINLWQPRFQWHGCRIPLSMVSHTIPSNVNYLSSCVCQNSF